MSLLICSSPACLSASLKRADQHADAMRTLQKELEELHEDRSRDREREHRHQQEHEEELQILRDRCEALEAERANGSGRVSVSPVCRPLTLTNISRPIPNSSDNYSLTCKGSWKNSRSSHGATTN